MIRLMEPKIGGENRERTPPSTVQFAGKVTGQVTSQAAGQVTGQVEAEQSYFCLLLFHLPLPGGAIKNAAGEWLKFRRCNRHFRRRDLSRACRPARREALELAQSARPSE
jgi:hypothetical protein